MTDSELKQFLDENKRYLESDLVKKNKITQKEFILNFSYIKSAVDQADECLKLPYDKCFNPSYNHLSMIRDTNGELHPVTVPCPKKHRHDLWMWNDYNAEIKDDEIPSIIKLAKLHKDDAINNKQCTKLNAIKLLLSIRDNITSANKKIPLKGIYIHGTPGVGKSFLMYRYCEMLHDYDLTTAFVSMPNLVGLIHESIENPNISRGSIISKLSNVDVLVLDDIGAEKGSDWFYKDLLFRVLDYRMNNNKLTFFTSNLTLVTYKAKLQRYVGGLSKTDVERVSERISVLTNHVDFALLDKNNRY